MAHAVALNVNGRAVTVSVDDPDTPLLYVLRNDLELHGPRFGCGLGAVRRLHGACGRRGGALLHHAGLVSSDGAEGSSRWRASASPEKPHPVQKAFIDEQAVQCGYCINGMIMQSAAFLGQKPNPTEADIRQALANNLCRCGTHVRIMRAVKRAAGKPLSGRISDDVISDLPPRASSKARGALVVSFAIAAAGPPSRK